jgi:hypothetical protein
MPRECTKRYSRGTDDRSIRARDYASARKRVNLSKVRNGHIAEISRDFAEWLRARRLSKSQSLERAFREHVERWKDETGHLSSITKAIAHPSYLRIIGLAQDSVDHQIENLLLKELKADPDHWFAALEAITGENPVKAEYDFDKAVGAWLRWGRERKII